MAFPPNVNSELKPFSVTLQAFDSSWRTSQGPFYLQAKTPDEALSNTRNQFRLPADETNYRFRVWDNGSYQETIFDLSGRQIQ